MPLTLLVFPRDSFVNSFALNHRCRTSRCCVLRHVSNLERCYEQRSGGTHFPDCSRRSRTNWHKQSHNELLPDVRGVGKVRPILCVE